MHKLVVYQYKSMVEFNLECLQILDFFGKLKKFDTLVVISKDEDEDKDDEWLGIINTLRNFTRHQFAKHAQRNQVV